MHKHIEWDDPGTQSVKTHYDKDPNASAEPVAGAILSARYRGRIVRVRVQTYRDETSIGDVAALIDPASGERLESFGKLSLGDTVRLPDDKRAFEPKVEESSEDD